MEPAWTKQIPNTLLCDWFYAFFLINLGLLALIVVAMLYLLLSSAKVPKGILGFRLFLLLIQLVIAGTGTLFFYLICDRSLKPVK
jgi:hypothetical protein